MLPDGFAFNPRANVTPAAGAAGQAAGQAIDISAPTDASLATVLADAVLPR
jgi:hypothetical protein